MLLLRLVDGLSLGVQYRVKTTVLTLKPLTVTA
jgi:hypothetical protein